MSKQKKDDISSGVRMVKDASVTKTLEELQEKIGNVDQDFAAIKALVKELKSRLDA